MSIRNTGGGSLTYSASVSTASGASWRDVSPATGSATPNSSGSLTVTLTPGKLAPGTYTGSLTITSAAARAPVVIPVSALVAAPA